MINSISGYVPDWSSDYGVPQPPLYFNVPLFLCWELVRQFLFSPWFYGSVCSGRQRRKIWIIILPRAAALWSRGLRSGGGFINNNAAVLNLARLSISIRPGIISPWAKENICFSASWCFQQRWNADACVWFSWLRFWMRGDLENTIWKERMSAEMNNLILTALQPVMLLLQYVSLSFLQ